MIMTSSAINKMLRDLNDEKELVLLRERQSCIYETVEGYDVVIPEYSFEDTQNKLYEIDEKVRKLKHGLNCLNTQNKLEHFDMTVDEALVYMAQLNKRKTVLDTMRQRPKTERKRGLRYGEQSGLVEYTHANYDISEVETQYKAVRDTINQIQMDIDYINQIVGVNVEI